MAAAPIDISAGLVPQAAAPVDISAGLVPKTDTPAASPSLWQKAKDDFNATVQSAKGAQPGDGAVKGFLQNVGQGGAQAVNAIVHPLDTLSNMASSFSHPQQSADAEVNQLYSDPSRFVGNAVGNAAVSGAAGEGVGAVAKAVAPTVVSAAGRAALLGKTPEAAYESALKPSTTIPAAQRAALVKTGLDSEIPVSKGGLETIGTAIEKLNQSIKDKISSDPTRPIDPDAVANRADQAKAKFSQQVNAGTDLKAIDASKQQFLDENPTLNAADAQAMKQGTYRVLNGKFGEQGSASVEAQKALARGLKEEIAAQFPEINGLNADESRLLDLQPVLERAVNRISNHQLIGIGTPVAGAAAKAVTGSGGIGVVASVLKSVLDNPMVKSRLAIAVSKATKAPIGQAMSRIQDYSTALGSGAGAIAQTSADQTPQQ